MSKVQLTGLSADDGTPLFADSDSQIGQVALQMNNQNGGAQGPMANMWQTAQGAFGVVTGLFDADSARVLRDDIEKRRNAIDVQRARLPALIDAADASTRPALRAIADIDAAQNDALSDQIDLADLQRRASLNTAIGGGLGLAGQFLQPNMSGGGAPGIGGGYAGQMAPGSFVWPVIAGAGGYLLGRDSDRNRNRG